MKLQAKSIFAFLLTLALSTCAPPDREPRLRPSIENPNLVVGQEVTVDVLVENAPVIYGADVRLVFDPNLLDVVDADESQDGVQPAHGDFLDPALSYILQYLADNETGGIDYALALLNPAPPVQGDGLLAQITFRAVAEGQATISIEDGLFGNQAGETIAPVLESTEISIAAMAGEDRSAPEEEKAVDQDSLIVEPSTAIGETSDDTTPIEKARGGSRFPFGLVVLGFGVVMVALAGLAGVGLVVGGWFWLGRTLAGLPHPFLS